MARPYLGVDRPDRRVVRPVHQEGRRLAVHPVRPWEGHWRQEDHRPARMASRWRAELRVRILG